jgi:lipid II:glycine glycyltransferase (peptidoglycan interpeptide bridge formation enzyme)
MSVQRFYKYADIPGSGLFLHRIPVFATQNYADYLKEFKGHDTTWLVKLENNKVTYLLPFAIIKKLIFSKGYFLTGVLSFDSGYTPDKEREFIEDIVLYIRTNKLCDWIQQGPNWAMFNLAPLDSKAVRFGTYRINLKDKNEDELFKAIKKIDRQDINKAIRSEVKVKKGIDILENSLTIINDTAKKGDLQSLTLNEAKKLLFHFNDHLKIYISYKDDIPQSSTIFLGDKYCVYALYSGSKTGPFRGSNSYLFWEAIKDAKKNNCNFFDFVGARINPIPGSKQERIQRFKEHFGGEFVQGYLWKINFSVIKYRIYSSLIRLWFFLKRKKYDGDIIDQEIKIMKT